MTTPLRVLEERQPKPFDYSALSPDLAEAAKKAAAAINGIGKRAIQEIGHHLLSAKEALPHGAFTTWAEAELGMTARTAQNYMAAARWLEGKPEPVSLLPAKVIYALAAPTTPPSLVEEVIASAEAGSLLEGEVIAHKIELARATERDVKARARYIGIEAARAEVAKERRKRTADREKYRSQTEHERQERAARLEKLTATAVDLVEFHPGVMATVLTAMGTSPHEFKDALSRALADRGSIHGNAPAVLLGEGGP